MSFSRGGRGISKPPVPMVDWSHPLAQGLVSCYIMDQFGGYPQDICASPVPHILGTGTPAWRGDGYFYNATDYTKGLLRSPIANRPYSFMLIVKPQVFNGNFAGFSLGSSGTNNNMAYVIMSGSTTFDWGHWGDDGNHTVPDMTNRTVFAVGSMNQAKVQRFFESGKFIDQRTSSSLYTGDTTISFPGNNAVFTTAISLVKGFALWNRALSDEECLWLWREPYSFLISGLMRRYPGSSILSPYTPYVDPFQQLLVQ